MSVMSTQKVANVRHFCDYARWDKFSSINHLLSMFYKYIRFGVFTVVNIKNINTMVFWRAASSC